MSRALWSAGAEATALVVLSEDEAGSVPRYPGSLRLPPDYQSDAIAVALQIRPGICYHFRLMTKSVT